jgi:hypothetical protein
MNAEISNMVLENFPAPSRLLATDMVGGVM